MAPTFLEKADHALKKAWKEILAPSRDSSRGEYLADERLAAHIRGAVNSSTKSYRYVLPTQLLAKVVDAKLDARCLQAARGGPGAFDARTLAQGIIVPFDQANEQVLGGSPEPYVNNPLRRPEVSARYRGQQKNVTDWDRLCEVLEAVERKEDPVFTRVAFMQTLLEIARRLQSTAIGYPVPRRVGLDTVMDMLADFLGARSGGDRLLASVAALFTVFGRRLGAYAEVRRGHITSADSAAGMAADIECVDKAGAVVLAVEVKDRSLAVSHVKAKMPEIRRRRISEILFVAQRRPVPEEDANLRDLIRREFVTGQNLYVTDFFSLARTVLTLFAEDGRAEFLREVGAQLEEYRSEMRHRRAWADLLRRL